MADAATDVPFARVAIVGVGLIGGSVAAAIRRTWPHVHVIGLDDPSVLREAERRALIDERGGAIDTLAGADLVVLATPVSAIIESIRIAGRAGSTSWITDVGSTKRRIVAAAADAGLRLFVGGHPMAGAERGGLDHARADLFDGRPWFLVSPQADQGVPPAVKQFVGGLGATPSPIDAAEHDRLMAYVSHAPQMLASALMLAAGEAVGESGLAASGRAFQDMTRLAASPAAVWRDIADTNADFIAEALQAIIAGAPLSAAALRDRAVVDRLFDRARAWRDRMAGGTPPLH